MGSLGDMNDLYNAQEVILLFETYENRFQFKHDWYGLNPTKWEMSRVIIALRTSSKVTDIKKKKKRSGFSLVNTILAFDSEILLPNLIQKNSKEDSQKDYNYKVYYNIKLNEDKEYMKKKNHNKNSKIGWKQLIRIRHDKAITNWLYKKDLDVTWRTFNLLLEKVSLDD